MNLHDFGPKRSSKRTRRQVTASDSKKGLGPVQWLAAEANVFSPTSITRRQLPPGVYTSEVTFNDSLLIKARDLRADDFLHCPGTLVNEVLQEIHGFWQLFTRFQQLGFLHRRGYLFYGPQGSGKSSVVHQVICQAVADGHVAFFCDKPASFLQGMLVFRKIEPERPVVCVFEDIDAIIEEHGDSELLQWLDGAYQIDRVVNLATTNYPEELDRRIVSRPRRFDRIVKVEGVPTETRRAYLTAKLPDLTGQELGRWVEKTAGLSFAAVAEMVISVTILGRDFEETLQRLRAMEGHRLSSNEYNRPGGMGFGSRETGE